MVEKPEEKKPEEAKAEEQKPEKYRETPEEIEQSRALIQQQSQEKSERLKEAELTTAQMRQERDAAQGRLNELTVVQPSWRQPAKGKPEKKSENELEVMDDAGEDYVTKADLKKLMSAVKSEMRTVFTEREEEFRIDQAERTLISQQNAALGEIQKFSNRLEVPENAYNDMVAAANETVPLWNSVNGPARVARYMMERMEHWKIQNSRKVKAGQDQENDAAMVEHNKNALQPAGSGISPPSQSDFEKQQQEAADEISPDDVPVQTS